jgi:cell division septum initiation protein DivIVA
MNIASLMEKLEELVSTGTGVPATGKVLVDKEKMAELVSQIQSALPADLQEAQEFLQMRENLINQALSEARRIRTSSEDEARSRVKESEVLREAHKQSEDIVAEAQRRAQRVLEEADMQANSRRADADRYAQATLTKLEEELSNVLTTIRHGIDAMSTAK